MIDIDAPLAGYQQPPADVVDIVDAEKAPVCSLSPDRQTLAWLHWKSLPSIEELAKPFLRLGGLRITPDGRLRRRTWHYVGLGFQPANGSTGEATVKVPDPARFCHAAWSPDSTHLSFTLATPDGLELWLANVENGSVRRLGEHYCNDFLGSPYSWLPDASGLLVRAVTDEPEPSIPHIPFGPSVRETSRRSATNRTYQDLLNSERDERLFEFYATSQLVEVSLDGECQPVGEPALWKFVSVSPDGSFLLTSRLQQPFSRAVPQYYFPRRLEVMDRQGSAVHLLAEQPAAEEIPIQGVRTGKRALRWQPLQPATLIWIEALDEGDPNREVDHRDRMLRLQAPFEAEPEELLRIEERYRSSWYLDRADQVMITEYDRDRRWLTTRLHHFGQDSGQDGSRVIFDRSIRDRYNDPGRPVFRRTPNGLHVVEITDDGHIHLAGDGASEEGERPFLDRMDLETLETERIFRSDADRWAEFVGFTGPANNQPPLLIRRESPSEPPNVFLLEDGEERRLSDHPDPHPDLTGVEKRILRYERADGVPLHGTLYLPPDYDGDRRPLLVWAYPREYNDPTTAGQVDAAPNRFTRLIGSSPLMLLTRGWPVLVAAMPVVGDPETANDTFVEQIVAAAEAAVKAAVEEGVADPERVGVGGHSYGAFMVAHLLAHSDLFRAGIARSGAYNRTLTPFGFQNERRTLWDAPEVYTRLSPIFFADQILAPILLIHGEDDNNSGTWVTQSKRLYHALEGLGGTARMVLLPHESHGYSARESVLHVLSEMFDWFRHWVAEPAD